MRLLAMLAALLIVGMLTYKNMDPGSHGSPAVGQDGSSRDAPKVPTNPAGVKDFGKDMDSFIQKQAAERKAAVEDAESP